MHRLLAAVLGCVLLTGCASSSRDPSGTWINQRAIDAAVDSGNLREALLAYGPNLEWQIDAALQRAVFTNGYQQNEGRLAQSEDGTFQVSFDTDHQEQLSQSGGKLIQAASAAWPEQHFNLTTPSSSTLGGTFTQALYTAYLGGTWKIEEGLGRGGLVLFGSDGSVKGLPGAERYALCLAGDCAAMNGDADGIWLQLGNQGNSWLFERDGKNLRIYQAINRAAADEMASLHKGTQYWKLVLQ